MSFSYKKPRGAGNIRNKSHSTNQLNFKNILDEYTGAASSNNTKNEDLKLKKQNISEGVEGNRSPFIKRHSLNHITRSPMINNRRRMSMLSV